jgi:hypothetical protein
MQLSHFIAAEATKAVKLDHRGRKCILQVKPNLAL